MKKPSALLVFRFLSILFFCVNLIISMVFPHRLVYLLFFCIWSVILLFFISKSSFRISEEEVDFGPFISRCIKNFLIAIGFFFGSKLFLEKELSFVIKYLIPETGSFYYLVLGYCLCISLLYLFFLGGFPKTVITSSPIDLTLAEKKLKNLQTFFFNFKEERRKITDIFPLTMGFVCFVVSKRRILLLLFVLSGVLDCFGLFICFFCLLVFLTNLACYEPFTLFIKKTYGDDSLSLLGFKGFFSLLSGATKNVYPWGVIGLGAGVAALKVINDNDFSHTSRRQKAHDERIEILNRSRPANDQLTPREVTPTNSLGNLSKMFGNGDTKIDIDLSRREGEKVDHGKNK